MKKLQIIQIVTVALMLAVSFYSGVIYSENAYKSQVLNLSNEVLAEQRKSQIAQEDLQKKLKEAQEASASAANITKLEIYTKISNYLDTEINPVGKTAEVTPTPAVEEPKK